MQPMTKISPYYIRLLQSILYDKLQQKILSYPLHSTRVACRTSIGSVVSEIRSSTIDAALEYTDD